MWKKSVNWPRKKSMTLWRSSLLLFIALSLPASDGELIDRVALLVGNRPVTLSEVRAYYAFHTGRPLPRQLNEADRDLIRRMMNVERLHEMVRRYGGGEMQDGWFRLAVHVLNGAHGYLFTQHFWMASCNISEGLLFDVLARELRVLRFIQARTGGVPDDNADLLAQMAEREAGEITVTNYLF